MGKSKKREQRQAEREKKRQLEAALKQRNQRRRILVLAIPVATVAAAATTWFYLDMPAITGAIILGGAMFWLFAGLGFLGSAVPPRDRIKAGSIDFGRKRK